MEDNRKILLVEDDRDMTQVMTDILEQAGYRSIAVSDCESAYRALEKESPDLVLLDLVLPDGSGFEVCRRAASGKEGIGCPVPVIILSAKSGLDCKIKSFMSGAVRYFTKPFDVEELIEAVSSVLANSRMPQTASA